MSTRGELAISVPDNLPAAASFDSVIPKPSLALDQCDSVFILKEHLSVKQRCLAEQKRRKQRATKKISIFIGSFIICFAPYVITRLTELLPRVGINRRWGIVSKCLTYSKAASDPFAYSLLRQQYRKALLSLANRLLRRDLYPSSGPNSSLDTENDYCLQRAS